MSIKMQSNISIDDDAWFPANETRRGRWDLHLSIICDEWSLIKCQMIYCPVFSNEYLWYVWLKLTSSPITALRPLIPLPLVPRIDDAFTLLFNAFPFVAAVVFIGLFGVVAAAVAVTAVAIATFVCFKLLINRVKHTELWFFINLHKFQNDVSLGQI